MKRGLIFLALILGACAEKPVTEEPKVDAKWVEGVSREHNHEVLKCYESALKKNKKIQGNLQLEVDTAASGDASAAIVKQGVSPDVDACVTAQAKAWKYPWLKAETKRIQENYHLYLNGEGNPMSEFGGPAMDQDQVKITVRTHLSEVQECYAKGVSKKSALRAGGKLILTWDILGSGEVTNVKTKEWFDPGVDRCIAEHVSKWKFPPPPNNMVANVTYPFTFEGPTVK